MGGALSPLGAAKLPNLSGPAIGAILAGTSADRPSRLTARAQVTLSGLSRRSPGKVDLEVITAEPRRPP